jgi:hypothetical protein
MVYLKEVEVVEVVEEEEEELEEVVVVVVVNVRLFVWQILEVSWAVWYF